MVVLQVSGYFVGLSGHGFAIEGDDLGPLADLVVVDHTRDVEAWDHSID